MSDVGWSLEVQVDHEFNGLFEKSIVFSKPSREPTYPSWGKGKSSTQNCRKVGDILAPRKVVIYNQQFEGDIFRMVFDSQGWCLMILPSWWEIRWFVSRHCTVPFTFLNATFWYFDWRVVGPLVTYRSKGGHLEERMMLWWKNLHSSHQMKSPWYSPWTWMISFGKWSLQDWMDHQKQSIPRKASPEQRKNPPTFFYTGWLIRIVIMVYYNPYTTGIYPEQPRFFSWFT